jgi:hypothetical protein
MNINIINMNINIEFNIKINIININKIINNWSLLQQLNFLLLIQTFFAFKLLAFFCFSTKIQNEKSLELSGSEFP